MVEGQSPQTEQIKQLEILDFPKYGTLYGRFLLASQAKTLQEAANIVDPNETVSLVWDLQTKDDALEKRNYNLAVESFSINERQEQWKDFIPSTEHSTAYSQWRTEFTGFMKQIEDRQRIRALKIIVSTIKEPVDFIEGDADQLFNDFCKDGSDLNKFITRVTKNLAHNGEINPTTLQELLPHLQWIASGLFGKNTASDVVTRLIELESAMYNNSNLVLDTFRADKVRINTPTDDEKRILGFLRDSFPVPQEGKTVTIEPTPQAAPVTTDEKPPSPTSRDIIEGGQGGNDAKDVAKATTEGVIDIGVKSGDLFTKLDEILKPKGEISEAGTEEIDAQVANATGNTIDLDPKGYLIGEINERLEQSQNESETFRASVDSLKDYIIAFAKSQGVKVKEGISIQVMDTDTIAIRKIELSKSKGIGPLKVTGTIKVDLILSNGLFDDIIVEIESFWENTAASILGGNIGSKIKEIDTVIKKELEKQLSPNNGAWTVRKISISGDKVLIEFETPLH